MTLGEIAKRAQCNPRQLRYILERELVPGVLMGDAGTGNWRDYSTAQAVLLVAAVELRQAGFRSNDALTQLLRQIWRIVRKPTTDQYYGTQQLTLSSRVRLNIDIGQIITQLNGG